MFNDKLTELGLKTAHFNIFFNLINKIIEKVICNKNTKEEF